MALLLEQLDETLAKARAEYEALEPEIAREQRVWEKALRGEDWTVREGLALHYPLEGMLAAGCHGGRPVVSGSEDCTLPFAPGRIGLAASFDGTRFIDGGDAARFNFEDPFTLAAWIYPKTDTGAIVSRIEDVPKGEGYGLYLLDGKVRLHITKRWTDLGMRLETTDPLELNRWHHVAVTYDGKRKSEGVRIYVNGQPRKIDVLFDQLLWPIEKKVPFRIGAGEGHRFRGVIDDVRIYRRALTADEASVLPLDDTLSDIARRRPTKRTRAERNKLALAFLDRFAPDHIRTVREALRAAQTERDEFHDSIPTVMVMRERKTLRETFLLKRGAYDAHGEKVRPAVPSVLPALAERYPNNRLGLARWLVDPKNPLTARVAVNRLWQMLFGSGLVRTVEDFGSQGEWPSHPELLDWLATEFVGRDWDVKALLRLIVTSATYRQASQVTPELVERDPENRLLARGPRQRLSAEMIRDQALAASGLLVEQIGGPPVKPYQPPGLWQELAFSTKDYERDQGDKLYRRSLYTYWRRTSPPPAMATFDASNREQCRVRHPRTNTPLQALNLMNDVTYLEASRKLAERMMTEGGSESSEQIRYGFRLATARDPRPEESRVLVRAYRELLASFEKDSKAAVDFLAQGDSPRNEALDTARLAASASVASLILNLDETVTKE